MAVYEALYYGYGVIHASIPVPAEDGDEKNS